VPRGLELDNGRAHLRAFGFFVVPLQEVKMQKFGALLVAVACLGLLAADAQAQRRDRDGPRRGGNWVALGCQKVSFLGKDRDIIRVGRREGRFKAIRLSATGNDVEILDLKVVYSNGAPDDIPVRSKLRAGSSTRALDLKGRERAIQQIEMTYRARLNFRGFATVCAEGLD
jgi:hypothetical protein